MGTTTAEATYVGADLADPRTHLHESARPLFRRLRDEQPVAWHSAQGGRRGFWVVTRYEDVLTVCRDRGTYGSTGGNVMDTLLAAGDPAAGRMLAVTDGPRHGAIRRLVSPALTQGALARIGDGIRNRATALVRRARDLGECDFARDIAAHIPLQAICDLLNVPEADRPAILRNTSAALGSEDVDADPETARLAKSELLLYFAKLAASRTGVPVDADRPDLIGLLVNGEIAGVRLTLEEIVLNCYSLILGGDETARLSMISGVLALIRHPGQWRAWRAGMPAGPAVQEILRWTTPAMHVGRTATVATTLRGQRIEAGEAVVAWLNSANADEREFALPDVFDLTRTPNRQLAFSYGAHFCVGSHLARMEIGALLAALREEVSSMEQTAPAVPLYSNFLHGYSSLPVSLR